MIRGSYMIPLDNDAWYSMMTKISAQCITLIQAFLHVSNGIIRIHLSDRSPHPTQKFAAGSIPNLNQFSNWNLPQIWW